MFAYSILFLELKILNANLSYTRNSYRNIRIIAPVAQSIEHRTAMREVVSSTPAGPTLRVLK